MLQALVRDLARLHGIEVVIARDPDIAVGPLPATATTIDRDDIWRSWRGIVDGVDAVWPVAPESDGVLERATRLATEVGRTVLNSRPAALATARSKRATARRLAADGVAVVPTEPLTGPTPDSAGGWVVKPDDGAGAAETYFAADTAALAEWRQRLAGRDFVVQPFLAGPPLSLSLLAQDGAAWLLACNTQRITCEESRFAYHGGLVGGAEERRPVLAPLAARIAASLPGLWGYVGVDLVDGPAGPVVLEVNPRLTTSYVGLGESIGANPAEFVLALREHKLATIARPLAPRPVDVRVAGAP